MAASPTNDCRLALETSTEALRSGSTAVAYSKAQGHFALLAFAIRDREPARAAHHVEAALTHLATAHRNLLTTGNGSR